MRAKAHANLQVAGDSRGEKDGELLGIARSYNYPALCPARDSVDLN